MRALRIRRFPVAAVLAEMLAAMLAASAAVAAPTGLSVIPTTDVVPAGQWTFQIQNGNTELRATGGLFAQPQPAFQTQVGLLAARIEGGIDVTAFDSPRDYRPVANLKAVPLLEGYDWPAIAVGVSQVVRGASPTWYAVASRTVNYASLAYQKFRAHHRNLKLHGFRVHAGVTGGQDDPRAMIGSDLELSEHVVLDADWVSGTEGSVTLGGVWVIDARTSAQAALLAGNADHRLDGLQVAFTRQFGW